MSSSSPQPQAIVAGVTFLGGALAGAFAWRLTKPILNTWHAKRQTAILAESESLGTELASLEEEARTLRAPLASAAAVALDAPAGLWSRDEFIRNAAKSVLGISNLLDLYLIDAFSASPGGASRAATSIRELLARAEDTVARDVRKRRDALITAAMGSSSATLLPAKHPVTTLLRALLVAAIDDAPFWHERAVDAVNIWLETVTLNGGDAIAIRTNPTCYAALLDAFTLHASLTLWPLAGDANLSFLVGVVIPTKDKDTTVKGILYDAESQQYISDDSKAPTTKTRVILAGPILAPRTPIDSGSGKNGRNRDAASAADIADIRGGARTLVVRA